MVVLPTKTQGVHKGGDYMIASTSEGFSVRRFHHPVESNLIFVTATSGSVLKEVTPVEVRSSDSGLKLPVHANTKVLVGRLHQEEGEFYFYVLSNDELNVWLDNRSETHDGSGIQQGILLEDLDILVREPWSAAEQSIFSFRTKQEREEFVRLKEGKGAKFVQMAVNTGCYDNAVWGIDHVVYPLEAFVTLDFLPVYMEHRSVERGRYDFNHRGGHPAMICWRK